MFLRRWQQNEPVRLYVYGVLTAMLAAAGVAGYVDGPTSAAIAGVITAAVLGPIGVESARSHVEPYDGRHRPEYVEAAYRALDELDGVEWSPRSRRGLAVGLAIAILTPAIVLAVIAL